MGGAEAAVVAAAVAVINPPGLGLDDGWSANSGVLRALGTNARPINPASLCA